MSKTDELSSIGQRWYRAGKDRKTRQKQGHTKYYTGWEFGLLLHTDVRHVDRDILLLSHRNLFHHQGGHWDNGSQIHTPRSPVERELQ